MQIDMAKLDTLEQRVETVGGVRYARTYSGAELLEEDELVGLPLAGPLPGEIQEVFAVQRQRVLFGGDIAVTKENPVTGNIEFSAGGKTVFSEVPSLAGEPDQTWFDFQTAGTNVSGGTVSSDYDNVRFAGGVTPVGQKVVVSSAYGDMRYNNINLTLPQSGRLLMCFHVRNYKELPTADATFGCGLFISNNATSVTDRVEIALTNAAARNGWIFAPFDLAALAAFTQTGTDAFTSDALGVGALAKVGAGFDYTQPVRSIRAYWSVNAAAITAGLEVTFDAILYNPAPPKAVFSIGYDNHVEPDSTGFSCLHDNGFRGYLALNIPAASDAFLAKWAQIYHYHKWEVMNHTTDHTVLTTLSTENDVLSKITPFTEWARQYGLRRGENTFAYPQGAANTLTRSTMLKHFDLVRSGAGGPLNPITTRGIADKYNLGGYDLGNKPWSKIKRLIDYAEATGSYVQFFAHGVNDSVADEESNTGDALLANGKALAKLGAYLRERVDAGTSRYMLPSEVASALL